MAKMSSAKRKDVPPEIHAAIAAVLLIISSVLEWRQYVGKDTARQLAADVVWADVDTGLEVEGEAGTDKLVYYGLLGLWMTPPSVQTQQPCPARHEGDGVNLPEGHRPVSTDGRLVAFRSGTEGSIVGRHLLKDEAHGVPPSSLPPQAAILRRTSYECSPSGRAWDYLNTTAIYPEGLRVGSFVVGGPALERIATQPAVPMGASNTGAECVPGEVRVEHAWNGVELPFTVLAMHQGGGVLVPYHGTVYKVRRGERSLRSMLAEELHPVDRLLHFLRFALVICGSAILVVSGLSLVAGVSLSCFISALSTTAADSFWWGLPFYRPAAISTLPFFLLLLLDCFLFWFCCYKKGRRPRVPVLTELLPQQNEEKEAAAEKKNK